MNTPANKRGTRPTRERIAAITSAIKGAQYHISSRDGDFLATVINQKFPLTVKQLCWLSDIEDKVFDKEESEDNLPERLENRMKCPACNGYGEVFEYVTCLRCNGTGEA
jgi:hypothetical protein